MSLDHILKAADKFMPVTAPSTQKVQGRLSTSMPQVDYALAQSYEEGGLPMGRIIEIFGPESSGKTMIATLACIETQKKGGFVIWHDYEHAFELDFAERLGLDGDPSKWRHFAPETGEEGFDAIYDFMKNIPEGNDVPITIVIDSIASIVTSGEAETRAEDGSMYSSTSLARFMSRNMKKLPNIASKKFVTFILLNQTRDNPSPFASNVETPGGNAVKFYASVRCQLHKKGRVKDGDRIVGEKIHIKVDKNKAGAPFYEAYWYTDVINGGIDTDRSTIEFMFDAGILVKKGGWVEVNGVKMREKEILETMKESPEFKADLLSLIDSFDGEVVIDKEKDFAHLLEDDDHGVEGEK